MATIIFFGLAVSVLLLIFIFPSPRKTNKVEQNNPLIIPAINIRQLPNLNMELKMVDNGGNRTGIDRRIFEYSAFIPERRSGGDRRKGYDRRHSLVRRRESERRSIFNIQLLN